MKNDHVPSPSNCKTCRENPSATSHSFLCEPLALKAFKGFQKHGGHPADEGQKYPLAFKLQGKRKSWRGFLSFPLQNVCAENLRKVSGIAEGIRRMKNGLHAPLSDCKARRRAEISPIFKLQDDGENPSATSHSFLCEPLAPKALKGIQKHDRHLAYEEQKHPLAFKS